MPFLLSLLLVAAPPSSVLTVPIFVPDPKVIWMNELAQCESGASTTQKTWDTNNQWSIGKYQYQYKTWARYSKLFGTTKANITDGELQDKVTRYVLDTKGWDDWFICGGRTEAKLGLYESQ